MFTQGSLHYSSLWNTDLVLSSVRLTQVCSIASCLPNLRADLGSGPALCPKRCPRRSTLPRVVGWQLKVASFLGARDEDWSPWALYLWHFLRPHAVQVIHGGSHLHTRLLPWKGDFAGTSDSDTGKYKSLGTRSAWVQILPSPPTPQICGFGKITDISRTSVSSSETWS